MLCVQDFALQHLVSRDAGILLWLRAGGLVCQLVLIGGDIGPWDCYGVFCYGVVSLHGGMYDTCIILGKVW